MFDQSHVSINADPAETVNDAQPAEELDEAIYASLFSEELQAARVARADQMVPLL